MGQANRRWRICVVVGTRPEAVKLAPVIRELKSAPWAEVNVLATAQHRQLLDQAFQDFGIAPDHDLDVMSPNQGLAKVTARILDRIADYFDRTEPDLVLGQGDTATVFATAVACFLARIPFGHVEAGLRSNDLGSPFPEEFNRVVASLATTLHFAPTAAAQASLLAEGVPASKVWVTGNTVIDALLQTSVRDHPTPLQFEADSRVVLLTAHRRENFGAPLRQVFEAVTALLSMFPKLHVVYPVHPNPNVGELANHVLGAQLRAHLMPPLAYPDLVAVLKRCDLVLTDSGGLQEEAPALGKPVLVLRNETERPEAVAAGVAELVGTDTSTIVSRVSRLLVDPAAYALMAKGVSPYGDGRASARICEIIRAFFHGDAQTGML